MKSPPWARRLIPTALGAAMLAIIVVAALTPNIGIGAAQPNCQYNCTNSQNNALEYALIGVLVAAILAALLILLVLQRRKKRGGPGGGAAAAYEEPQGGASGPGASMDSSGAGDYGGVPPGSAAPYGAAAAGAGVATYDEGAAPVEAGPDWAEVAAPAAAGSAVAMDEAEPDIDRLMKELDQISDDILKKSPAKKGAAPGPSVDDAGTDP